jgi:hypothetical protein
MQRRRKPRTLSRVADITGLPPHLIRYHVERGRIPIRHRPNQAHYYSDAEIRVIGGRGKQEGPGREAPLNVGR